MAEGTFQVNLALPSAGAARPEAGATSNSRAPPRRVSRSVSDLDTALKQLRTDHI